MPGFELIKKLPCRPDPSSSGVLQPLPDAFLGAGERSRVEQALICSGILHNRRSLSVHSKHNRPLAFSQQLHKIAGTPPKSRQRLNILSNVKHASSSGVSTFLGAHSIPYRVIEN
jgi:hypothetical protein